VSTPRTITRSAFIDVLATGLGLDPRRTTHVWIARGQIVAELITDRDDPDATISYDGAAARKLVRIVVVEDGAAS
jgi:hypothetical protein